MPHPIENMLRTTMEQLHQIVDVDTVIGSPVAVDGASSCLSRAYRSPAHGRGANTRDRATRRAGGRTFDGAGAPYPFTGASALGLCLTPVAFLTIQDGRVSSVPSLVRGDAGAADRPRDRSCSPRRSGCSLRSSSAKKANPARRAASNERAAAARCAAARAAAAARAGARGGAPPAVWRARRGAHGGGDGAAAVCTGVGRAAAHGQHHEDHDGANRAGAVQRGRDGHRPARGVRRGGLEHVPERGRGVAALRFAVRAHARLRQRRGRGHRLPCGGQRGGVRRADERARAGARLHG